MALGSPVTDKFPIGTAEIRLGALAEALKHLPTHSIGQLDDVPYLQLCENRPYDGLDAAEVGRLVLEIGGMGDRLERVLSAESKARLLGWLEQSPTGRSRLRAGLPKGWRAGDNWRLGAAWGFDGAIGGGRAYISLGYGF